MGYEADIATQLLQIRCCFCGKALRDPVSVERGWGPDCDEKYMDGVGAAGVFRAMSDLFDPAEAAEAIRLAPNVVPERWVQPTKLAQKGEALADGTQAEGGEILAATPLNVRGFRDFLIARGGEPDDPKAPWRHDTEVRRKMVSNAMWYASRAATFGFGTEVSVAEKVDVRFLVIASAQRLARAVGLHGAADRIANFYAARVVKIATKLAKERGAGAAERDAIIFETDVPAGYRTFQGARQGLPPGMVRLHTPYSEQFNNVARQSKDLFVAFEKDPPYFWRYFPQARTRDVVNILLGCYGDRPSLTRLMTSLAERSARARRRATMKPIVDSWTGEIRTFDAKTAAELLTDKRYKEVKL